MTTLEKIRAEIANEKGTFPKEHYIRILDKYAEQEPCDDVVRRQAVLDIINFEDKWLLDANGHNANIEIAFSGMKSRISNLPPVRPQEQTGHWINRHIIASKTIDMIVCSECREEFSYDAETGISEYNYCPNCGAKMVEPQESE